MARHSQHWKIVPCQLCSIPSKGRIITLYVHTVGGGKQVHASTLRSPCMQLVTDIRAELTVYPNAGLVGNVQMSTGMHHQHTY
jgi:hypothetical protein